MIIADVIISMDIESGSCLLCLVPKKNSMTVVQCYVLVIAQQGIVIKT